MVDHWFIWLMLPLHFVPYPVRALRIIILYHVREYVQAGDNPPTGCWASIWGYFKKHGKLTSDRAAMGLMLVFTGVAIVLGVYRNFTQPENWPAERGKEFNNDIYYYVCTVLVILVSVFLWLGVYFQRKIQDELKLVIELRTIGILWLVLIGMYVVTSLAKVKPNVVPSGFIIILSVLSFLTSFGMPIWLAWVTPKVDAVDVTEEAEVKAEVEEFVEVNEDERPEFIELKKLDRFDEAFLACNVWRNLFLSFLQVRMCEEGL
jgi:hypothetical protein